MPGGRRIKKVWRPQGVLGAREQRSGDPLAWFAEAVLAPSTRGQRIVHFGENATTPAHLRGLRQS